MDQSNIKTMKSKVLNTRGSFDYQWRNIPEGAYLLSDAAFRENVDKILLDELDVSKEFLKKKFIVDAGCGNGRWTYGLLKLGCKVVAFDYTISGCKETKNNVKQFDNVDVLLADIIHPPLKENTFDIAFCWGVLHHTKNMKLAFQKVANLVKHGGLLHVFVYGRKSWKMKIWRKILSNFSYNSRLAVIKSITKIVNVFPKLRILFPFSPSVHGSFDAYSPSINTESSSGDINALFGNNSFKYIRKLNPIWCNAAFSLDVHMQGVKQ